MGDFVTVDEVGDVTALNDFPHTPSPAPPEKTTEQEQSLTFVPLDTHEVKHSYDFQILLRCLRMCLKSSFPFFLPLQGHTFG